MLLHDWDIFHDFRTCRIDNRDITAFADQVDGRTTRIEDIDMVGKVTMRNAAQAQVIAATCRDLECFTRDELRAYAKSISVETGQNKEDTISNLIASGKATICATLGN